MKTHSCSIIHHFSPMNLTAWILKNLDLIFFPSQPDSLYTWLENVCGVESELEDLTSAISNCPYFFLTRSGTFFWQVVFLTGFGYVYVDIAHQCGRVLITIAPEGKAGPVLGSTNRWVCLPSSSAASFLLWYCKPTSYHSCCTHAF